MFIDTLTVFKALRHAQESEQVLYLKEDATAKEEEYSFKMLMLLAHSSHPIVLEYVSYTPLEDVQTYVAMNEDCPVFVLHDLAQSPLLSVRIAVAGNPHLPYELVDALLSDEHNAVPVAVAKNPSTPLHVLIALSRHELPSVRMGVAMNLATSAQLLMKLKNDSNRFVRSVANKELSRLTRENKDLHNETEQS